MKKVEGTQLSYDVTDAEKYQANKAIIAFNYTLKVLRQAKEHLNIMLTPFKDHQDISEEQIFKFRSSLRSYRDKAIENFNNFKIASFRCITLMQMFLSDTQIHKLMKSFESSIDVLEAKVNEFAEIFSNLKDKEFIKKLTEAIEKIQSECDVIEDIIEDRLKSHIQTNILASNWVDNIGKKLNKVLDHKDPLMIQLFKDNKNGE